MTPEQKAIVSIDALLVAAGWHVCNVANANIDASTGVAIREFPLNNGFGFADYLLYVNGKACSVIEAKKEGATLWPRPGRGRWRQRQLRRVPHQNRGDRGRCQGRQRLLAGNARQSHRRQLTA